MHFKYRGRYLLFFHFRFGRLVFPWVPMESRTQSLYKVVGISLIAYLYKRRYNDFYLRFMGNLAISGFSAAILESLVMIVPSHSPDIFRKSHQRISIYSNWF